MYLFCHLLIAGKPCGYIEEANPLISPAAGFKPLIKDLFSKHLVTPADSDNRDALLVCPDNISSSTTRLKQKKIFDGILCTGNNDTVVSTKWFTRM